MAMLMLLGSAWMGSGVNSRAEWTQARGGAALVVSPAADQPLPGCAGLQRSPCPPPPQPDCLSQWGAYIPFPCA